MTEQEQVGYAMRVAHEMAQAFLGVIGEEPGPAIEEMEPEKQQRLADMVAACRSSKNFRFVLSNATKGNFANRPDEMQGLLLLISARLGWLDLKMVMESEGSV